MGKRKLIDLLENNIVAPESFHLKPDADGYEEQRTFVEQLETFARAMHSLDRVVIVRVDDDGGLEVSSVEQLV